MKKILTALFCMVGIALAQTATIPAGDGRKWLQKVIDVKYADPIPLADLLGYMQQGGSSDRVRPQPQLHAISIGTYDPSFLKLAEEIISRYDVPQAKPAITPQQRGIEIVAHILLAGSKGSSGDALPVDLEPVAKQLRSVFGYTDIRLLDSALVRGRENRSSEVSGTLGEFGEEKKPPQIYRIRIKNISVQPSAKGDSIGLEGFGFTAKVLYNTGQSQYQFMDLGFDTDLSILASQKVVVGKTRIGSGSEALILVLSARVVE